LARRPDVKPEHLSLLIGCYARRKQFSEALDLCGRAWEVCTPEVAARMSLAVLRSGVSERGQMARVEGWFQKALAKGPAVSPEFLLSLADLKDLQGDYADAEAAYRKLLARDGDNSAALNNLAWLLAAKGGDAQEALRLINRAIDRAGPCAELLDTRAFVQLTLRNHGEAREDLLKATREAPAATRYFHLARAHRMAQDLPAASAALKQAKAAGLAADRLHPLERPAYKELLEALPQR
jgi:tetratricopeptide (TPR) repeat protein